MLIRIQRLTLLQCAALATVITNAVVSLNLIESLPLLSYAVLALVLLFFVFLLTMYFRRPQLSRFGLCAVLYFLVLITVTMLNGTDIKRVVYTAVEVALLFLIFHYFRDRVDLSVKTCAAVFSLIIYANLAYMILNPAWAFMSKDMLENFPLGGNYNQMGGRMLCGLAVNVLCLQYSRKWLINIIPLFVASYIALFFVGSMTSLTVVTMFLIVCLLPTTRLKRWATIAAAIVFLLFQVVIVFGGQGLYNNALATYFIEDVLGKSMTFTYRTVLWDASGQMFWQSPIWGYGEVDTEWYLSNLSNQAVGPHNFVYSVLLKGGLLLAALLVALIIVPVRRLLTCKMNASSARLLAALTLWFFMSLMEVYPVFCLFFLLLLVYYYPEMAHKTRNP